MECHVTFLIFKNFLIKRRSLPNLQIHPWIWGVQNDRTGLASNFTTRSTFPDPYPSRYGDMGPLVGQIDRKSSIFFAFGYETCGVQLNEHMEGIIFGIRID